VMRDGSEFEFGYMLFRRSVDRFVRQSHDEVRFERVGR
jgi:hypothetical protein